MKVTQEAISAAWLLLFLSPLLILLAYSNPFAFFDGVSPQTQSAVAFTVLQALAVAGLSCLLGLVGAMGLIAVQDRFAAFGRSAQGIAVLSSSLPSLMVCLSFMNVAPGAHGTWAVIVVQVLTNCGLASAILAYLIRQKLGGLSELAFVEGASTFAFIRKAALPLVLPDALKLGLFFFSVSLTCFAPALILGGGSATTIEVLIYQKIRTSLDWSSAVELAFVQSLAGVALSWFFVRGQTVNLKMANKLPLVAWPLGLVVALGPFFVFISSLLVDIPKGFAMLSRLPTLVESLPLILGQTFLVALLTSIFAAILLLAIAYFPPNGKIKKALLGVVPPSGLLFGFALILLWRTPGLATFIKIALGLSIAALPAFYRLAWSTALDSLSEQVLVAKTMGAGRWLIFSKIVLPQVLPMMAFLAGLAAFWAWGDFALTRIVAEGPITLSLLAQGLIESYQTEAASIIILIGLTLGLVQLMLTWGIGYVVSQKSLR